MVQGFNHNIRHKGKLYHVQTEDSGRDNPHIITHVFVGGNILATKKTSYADIVKADRLESIVRELMEEQHKAVLRNLISGTYDNETPGAPAPETSKAEPAKPEPSKPAAVPAPAPAAAAAAPKPPVAQPAAAAANAARPAARPANPPPQPSKERSLDEIILSYLADREES